MYVMGYPAYEFKIHHSRTGRTFYWVRVFDTYKELAEWVDQHEWRRGAADGAAALCFSYTVDRVDKHGKSKRTRELGEILLCRKRCTVGVIAHECLHATLFYMRRVGRWFAANALDPDVLQSSNSIPEDEEYACWVLGNLVSQVVRKGYDHGIFDKEVENEQC